MSDVPDSDDLDVLRARLAKLERRLSELRELEEAVLGARAQAQALLDNIPHVAWMKDVDGVFLAINEPFAKSAGMSRETILGKTDVELWPIELAERYQADDRRVMERGEQILVEEPIADVNGTRWFETFKTAIRDARGHVSGTVGMARDITQRKEDEIRRRTLEERMQQLQKLESLGVLAGGIAHDFNNLLMGVLANAELANAAIGKNDDDVRARLRDIRRAASSAAELTDQMLAYSGRGRFVVRPISLNEMVEEIGQLVRVSISKKARLLLELQASLPSVVADVAQMHQLVMNLITNASDAFEGRTGTIRVRTGVRTVAGPVDDLFGPDPLEPGAYVVLSVTDDGCGIDPATQARIFEPFFTTKFTGRGLGLAAVQGIVRGHGGGITLRSALGEGTSIEVLLPCSDEPVAQAAGPDRSAEDEWPRGARVLVVDDDATVRTVTGLILHSLGFEVVAAASGTEAIETFEVRAEDIYFVVLDVTMPDINGEQVLVELRKRRADVPVILASGYTELEMRERVEPGEVDGFLHKPFGLEDMRACVREALRHRRGGD